MTRFTHILLMTFAVCFSLLGSRSACGSLINGSFEEPVLTPGAASFHILDQSVIPGWSTTDSLGRMELWTDGFGGFDSFHGNQHAEINAFENSTLFQDVSGILDGAQVGFTFAHRGRSGVDTMRLSITDLGIDQTFGTLDDTLLFSKEYSTDNDAWVEYTSQNEAAFYALGNDVRFGYEAVDTASGNPSIGNFIDAVGFGTEFAPNSAVPEPATYAMWTLFSLGALLLRRRSLL